MASLDHGIGQSFAVVCSLGNSRYLPTFEQFMCMPDSNYGVPSTKRNLLSSKQMFSDWVRFPHCYAKSLASMEIKNGEDTS
jgi:hypothetical protein